MGALLCILLWDSFSAVSHRLHPADSQCQIYFYEKDKLRFLSPRCECMMIVTITYKEAVLCEIKL